MHDIKIGKLKNRYVVYWYEIPGNLKSKRRFRLKAKNLKEARPEAKRVYEAQMILKGSTLTFEDISKLYLKSLSGRSSEKNVEYLLRRHLLPFFGSYFPLQIGDDEVEEYLEERRSDSWDRKGKELSNGTLNSEIGLVQTVLNFGYKKNFIGKPQKLKRPSKPVPRDRWLNIDEIEKLVDASKTEPHLQVALIIMLATAGRVSSVLELTWERVDFKNRTIDLRVDPKRPAKGRAIVPMNSTAYEVLSRWKPMCDTDYVVEFRGGPIRTIRSAFETAVNRAGLKNVSPHTIRHTAAVHMVAAGCSLQRVSQYLGHTSIQVTEKHYARYAPEHLHKEAEAVDFFAQRGDILDVIPLTR